jgi:MFS family permease
MAKCSLGCLNLSPVALLAYFCLLNILMYIDRGAVASLVTAFEDDPNLHLSNFQAGVVGSVFMFGFMIASPIFANASQSVHAFTLITVGVTIWAGSCLLAGVSNSFGLLVAARALSGIGEASFVCLASPIILSKAPADKKNLWISIFYSALTIGYALGYVIAPPVKNGFGGWQYVFFLEMIASAPFIIIAFFAYRDPSLMFKKEQKVSMIVQFKELWKNKVYCFMVLGYGAFTFTVGGLAFWGPAILQREYNKSETVASMSLGFITIFSGLVATVLGSVILEKMLKPYRLEFEDGKISMRKYSYYITEKANKVITRVAIGCLIVGLAGAIFAPTLPGPKGPGPFAFFLLCLCISEFLLFL